MTAGLKWTEPPLPLECERPTVFAAPWEAQIFAIVVKLHEVGLFAWRDFADRLSAEIHAHPGQDYYESWADVAVELLMDNGCIVEAELLEQSCAVERFRASDHHHVARTTPIAVFRGMELKLEDSDRR
jgi:nitrile hydratase accessory protein